MGGSPAHAFNRLPLIRNILARLINLTVAPPPIRARASTHYDGAMSHFRRPITGSTFFFTLVAWRRRPILCDDMIRNALRDAIRTVRARRPFTIDAWVQLPDHLHCIWTLPQDDIDFPRRWSEIKHSVSYACRDRYDGPGLSPSMTRRRLATIWQPRFWEHQIKDEHDFSRHIDYIHINPVRHGLVGHASLWPYSSFGRYVRDGIYPADWCGPVGLQELLLE